MSLGQVKSVQSVVTQQRRLCISPALTVIVSKIILFRTVVASADSQDLGRAPTLWVPDPSRELADCYR